MTWMHTFRMMRRLYRVRLVRFNASGEDIEVECTHASAGKSVASRRKRDFTAEAPKDGEVIEGAEDAVLG